jgi:outer membrane protein TolC
MKRNYSLHLGVALSLLFLGTPLNGQTPASSLAQTPTQADLAGTMKLDMQQAIEMALENNLDVVISRLAYQAQGENVGRAKGAYNPLFSADFNNLRSRAPASSQLSGATTLTNFNTAYNFSWQQELSTGGNYFIAFENLRASTNNVFFSFNPRFDSALSAQIAQPILQNRQLNPIKQQVVVAQNGERIARHQFQAEVMDLVSDVEQAYWDWVFSIRDLDVNQKSLQLARDLLRNNRIQVEVGTMAPIDVLEAEAEVAARENGVIIAEEAIARTTDEMRRLINDPSALDFWGLQIEPAEEPLLSEVEIDLDEAVRTALARRPAIAESHVELDTRNFNVRYTKNQKLPRVDLIGSYALNGLGGDEIIRDAFGGGIIDEIPGGYNDSLEQLFSNEFRDWSLGLIFSYPLGNSSADAAHAQAQADYRRQRAVLESQELVIAQQVRITARLVQTNRKRIESNRVARELMFRRMEAEQKKFEVGMSTSFLIVQAQRDLAVAAGEYLQSVIDYNKSIVAFRRVTGTILDKHQINVR